MSKIVPWYIDLISILVDKKGNWFAVKPTLKLTIIVGLGPFVFSTWPSRDHVLDFATKSSTLYLSYKNLFIKERKVKFILIKHTEIPTDASCLTRLSNDHFPPILGTNLFFDLSWKIEVTDYMKEWPNGKCADNNWSMTADLVCRAVNSSSIKSLPCYSYDDWKSQKNC